MRATKISKILVGAGIEIDKTIICKIFHSLEENWSAADEFASLTHLHQMNEID